MLIAPEHCSRDVKNFIDQLDSVPEEEFRAFYAGYDYLFNLLPYLADALEDVGSPLAKGLRIVHQLNKWPNSYTGESTITGKHEWTWWRRDVGSDRITSSGIFKLDFDKLQAGALGAVKERNYYNLSEALLDLAQALTQE